MQKEIFAPSEPEKLEGGSTAEFEHFVQRGDTLYSLLRETYLVNQIVIEEILAAGRAQNFELGQIRPGDLVRVSDKKFEIQRKDEIIFQTEISAGIESEKQHDSTSVFEKMARHFSRLLGDSFRRETKGGGEYFTAWPRRVGNWTPDIFLSSSGDLFFRPSKDKFERLLGSDQTLDWIGVERFLLNFEVFFQNFVPDSAPENFYPKVEPEVARQTGNWLRAYVGTDYSFATDCVSIGKRMQEKMGHNFGVLNDFVHYVDRSPTKSVFQYLHQIKGAEKMHGVEVLAHLRHAAASLKNGEKIYFLVGFSAQKDGEHAGFLEVDHRQNITIFHATTNSIRLPNGEVALLEPGSMHGMVREKIYQNGKYAGYYQLRPTKPWAHVRVGAAPEIPVTKPIRIGHFVREPLQSYLAKNPKFAQNMYLENLNAAPNPKLVENFFDSQG